MNDTHNSNLNQINETVQIRNHVSKNTIKLGT